MNLSKSGLSFTRRTKWGSYSTRGFSVRTGIPGLYYRKRYSKKDGGFMAIILILAAIVIQVVLLLLRITFLVLFVVVKLALICVALLLTVLWEVGKWCVLTFWDFCKYCFERWQARRLQNHQPPIIAENALAVEIQNEQQSSEIATVEPTELSKD